MFCCISSELNICSFWDVSTQLFAILFSRFSGLNFFQWSSREIELLQWLPQGSHQSTGGHGLSQSPTLDCSAKCRFPVLLKDPKRRGGGPGAAWGSWQWGSEKPEGKVRPEREKWELGCLWRSQGQSLAGHSPREARLFKKKILGEGAKKDGVCFLFQGNYGPTGVPRCRGCARQTIPKPSKNHCYSSSRYALSLLSLFSFPCPVIPLSKGEAGGEPEAGAWRNGPSAGGHRPSQALLSPGHPRL